MRDDVNMSLLCVVDAMLVICCIRRLPPYSDCAGKAMGRRICVRISMPSHDVFLQLVGNVLSATFEHNKLICLLGERKRNAGEVWRKCSQILPQPRVLACSSNSSGSPHAK